MWAQTAGGLRRYTNTGYRLLEIRLRAVFGNWHAERDEGQWVCTHCLQPGHQLDDTVTCPRRRGMGGRGVPE